ncbi:apolipoprotein N-acyltransferase [Pseudooceanicola batsensis HTCC2597]|uniref:Apolipoprotein N-acyltransferase n=1 Tax=Pseudooceanicola batsensis (strain ATCC BAA-863 / DSM 15984 / KCTC 12145 / HTCC2597) TaxID=252305 RepID=A3U2C1_PSEBH|nr:apolipoprotein N-acyltransferase [Pseudooceanicola batsensis]EAQ01721.1 apolipoprotein N-acyltransferase [Pseudooceanicola batsensis HTCC2597]
MTRDRAASWPGRIAAWPLRRRMLLAALAGALAGSGQAPFGLWPLTLLGLAAVHALAMTEGAPRRVAAVWWAGGAGYFALALSWIVEPFLVDIDRHGWMAPFALVLLAGGLGLFWGAAGALARLVVPGQGGAFAAAMTLSLVLSGYLRGLLFTGFPWALPGHVLIGTPLLQLAQWGGAMFLSLIVVGFALALPRALARPRPRLAIWLVLMVPLPVLGMALLPPQAPAEGRPVVRLVQPNIPQRDKWDPAKATANFDRMLAMTADPGDPDLVVWPETAIPAWLESIPHLLPMLSEAAGGSPLAFGINRSEGARIYNAMVLLDGGGAIDDVYDKHHLVPFGEYIPFGDILGRLGLRGLAQREGGGFSRGTGARLMQVPGIGSTLPLICYEGIFPRHVAAAERPEVLLLITNDAWFGTVSGPYQHLAQARLRAVEQGLPMIRVANTGISAVIDPAGRLSGVMALGTGGVRDVPLPLAEEPTIYARTGDTPIAIALLVALSVLRLLRRFARRV